MSQSFNKSYLTLAVMLSIGTGSAFAADSPAAKVTQPAARAASPKPAARTPKAVAYRAPANAPGMAKAAKAAAKKPAAGAATTSAFPAEVSTPLGAEPIQDTQAVLKEMESVLLQSVVDIGTKYKTLVSQPDEYMAKLPSQEQVLQNKDQVNFKNYGGLSEVFLFHDKVQKAQELYDFTAKNSATVLGADDPLPGLVSGDFALYYYAKGNYAKAEPLFKAAATTMERAWTVQPKLKDHLISAYLGLAEVYDKQGRKTEAADYLGKMIKLSKAQ